MHRFKNSFRVAYKWFRRSLFLIHKFLQTSKGHLRGKKNSLGFSNDIICNRDRGLKCVTYKQQMQCTTMNRNVAWVIVITLCLSSYVYAQDLDSDNDSNNRVGWDVLIGAYEQFLLFALPLWPNDANLLHLLLDVISVPRLCYSFYEVSCCVSRWAVYPINNVKPDTPAKGHSDLRYLTIHPFTLCFRLSPPTP